MDPESGLWGAVVAVVGLVGAVYAGRRGPTTPGDVPGAPSGPAEVVEISGQLQVSPAIWQTMQGKISQLERKVDHLTDLMEQSATRESRLRELLRLAMQIIRRANRRLDQAGLPEEPVPAELGPYQ